MGYFPLFFFFFFTLLSVLSAFSMPGFAENEDPGLVMNFYKDSCPQAEDIIKEQVKLLYKRHKNTAFSWLRNIFHDCAVQSCDASLLLDSTRSLSEKETDRSFVDNAVLLNRNPIQQGAVIKPKKKRNLTGTPDPNAEVIALSPRTLMATNRFVCEVCKKGFQRDQNLQLHRRGYNLPWKLWQRNGREIRKGVYVCPEMSCVHHHPSRALGDLTGIKKSTFCNFVTMETSAKKSTELRSEEEKRD